jgi:hypothetical protein
MMSSLVHERNNLEQPRIIDRLAVNQQSLDRGAAGRCHGSAATGANRSDVGINFCSNRHWRADLTPARETGSYLAA